MIDQCSAIMTSRDYLVLLDADMVLRVSPEWDWAKLDGRDVYNLIQISEVEYENVRMLRRNASRVRVVGATHEYYDVPMEHCKGFIPKELIYIEDVGDGKAKSDKYERDERLLRQDLEKDPNNARTVFYLANMLRDTDRYDEAIPLFERRSKMANGWWVEKEYALFMLAHCYLGLEDLDNARLYAEQAATLSHRAEPLYELVFYLRGQGKYELAWYYCVLATSIPKPPVERALFISINIYHFWLDYERAMLSRHVFPTPPILSLQAGLDFFNNLYVPQYLRNMFYNKELRHSVRPLQTVADVGQLSRQHDQDPKNMPSDPVAKEEIAVSYQGSGQRGIKETEVSRLASATQRVLTEKSQDERAPPQVQLPGATHAGAHTLCIAQWYPLHIGRVGESGCTPQQQVHGLRCFSFFSQASEAALYNGETWVLARSFSSTPLAESGSEESTDGCFYHMVIFDANSQGLHASVHIIGCGTGPRVSVPGYTCGEE